MFRAEITRRVQFVPEGESMTKQALAYDCDVNVIVSRYVKTGDASIFNQREGRFGDVSEVGDYASCLANVEAARAAFALLPARVRDQFGNDPAELVKAAFDPARRAELEAAGILVPAQTPQAAPGASSAAASSSASGAAAAGAASSS